MRRVKNDENIDYVHQWSIFADLKVIAMLTGLKAEWQTLLLPVKCESPTRKMLYILKEWPSRGDGMIGKKYLFLSLGGQKNHNPFCTSRKDFLI